MYKVEVGLRTKTYIDFRVGEPEDGCVVTTC